MTPTFSALNDFEIVIIGGYSGLNILGDAVLFDSRTNTFTKSAIKVHHSRMVFCPGDQAAQTSLDTVVSLVSSKTFDPMLIEYTKGATSLTVLEYLQN